MTRLGDSLKFFGNNFFSQEKTKYVVTFGALLKYTILHGKIDLATFGATFGKIGLHCIPTSGHSDSNFHLNGLKLLIG